MFLFSDEGGKIISRLEGKGSFWSQYGTLIIIAIVVLTLVSLFVILYLVGRHEENKKARTVIHNGEEVDSALLVRVTMIGHEVVTLFKDEVFIAPLVERDNYDFAGWFYDTAFTKPYYNRKVKSDIVLYPKWIKSS